MCLAVCVFKFPTFWKSLDFQTAISTQYLRSRLPDVGMRRRGVSCGFGMILPDMEYNEFKPSVVRI